MLGLVAAQLKHRAEVGLITQRPVWVDVCTTWPRVEQMADMTRLGVELVTSNRP
jgi:betaine lipid synthase